MWTIAATINQPASSGGPKDLAIGSGIAVFVALVFALGLYRRWKQLAVRRGPSEWWS